MKKIIAAFITFTVATLLMVSLTVGASARNWIISPIASTYTDTSTSKGYTNVDHDKEHSKTTNYFTRPDEKTDPTKPGEPGKTNPFTRGTTENNTTGSGNNNGTTVKGRDVTGATKYRKEITSKNEYKTNPGKDDPDSPNYTGKREIQSDKNLTSPDTASENKHDILFVLVPIAVVVVVSVIVLL